MSGLRGQPFVEGDVEVEELLFVAVFVGERVHHFDVELGSSKGVIVELANVVEEVAGKGAVWVDGGAFEAEVLFVGRMMDRGVGPHPIPQFEVHFLESARPEIAAAIEASGLRALVHPLTDDDFADAVAQRVDVDLDRVFEEAVDQCRTLRGEAAFPSE